MTTRLQLFLKAENLSQSQFADSIGVARASITHILSGRNKPGYDFISSMASVYPQLNLEWLILGKGEMFKSSSDVDARKEPDSLSLFPPGEESGENSLFGYSEAEQYNSGKSTGSPLPDENNGNTQKVGKARSSIVSQVFNQHNYSSSKRTERSNDKSTSIPDSQTVFKQRSVMKVVVFFDDGTYQELGQSYIH